MEFNLEDYLEQVHFWTKCIFFGWSKIYGLSNIRALTISSPFKLTKMKDFKTIGKIEPFRNAAKHAVMQMIVI